MPPGGGARARGRRPPCGRSGAMTRRAEPIDRQTRSILPHASSQKGRRARGRVQVPVRPVCRDRLVGAAWEVAVLAPVSACSGRPRPGFCHQIEILQAAVDTVRIDVRGRPTGISLEVGVAPCEDGAGDPNEQRMLDRAHVAAMVGPWPARPAGTFDAPRLTVTWWRRRWARTSERSSTKASPRSWPGTRRPSNSRTGRASSLCPRRDTT